MQLWSWLSNRRFRQILGGLVVLATVIVFIYFFATHQHYLAILSRLPFWVIPAIIVLNFGVLLTLVFIFNLILEPSGHRLPFREQFSLTAYSSIANFFGPLQSGPGVRAVYLKTKHQVNVRTFVFGMLVYYATFALISVLLLFSTSVPGWLAVLAFLVVAAVCWAVIKRYQSNQQSGSGILNPIILLRMFGLTLVQAVFVAAYYFVELRVVDAHVSLQQALTYSGAANFALFVSLTPDAVGIREAFLALTVRLHHIPNGVMLSANLIDRAAYVLFLGIIFIFVLAIHARDKFRPKAHPESD